MKKSSIKGGGFGVIALCDCSPKEFITIYWVKKSIILTCTRTS